MPRATVTTTPGTVSTIETTGRGSGTTLASSGIPVVVTTARAGHTVAVHGTVNAKAVVTGPVFDNPA